MKTHQEIRDALTRCSDLSQAQIDWLKTHGIDPFDLAAPWAVSSAPVVFNEAGLFDFSDEIEGDQIFETALIVPESDADGLLLDLVAFAPKSKRAASWLGRVGWCGNIGQARLGADNGLLVHRDPLRWLASKREGVWLFAASIAANFGLPVCAPFAVENLETERWLRSVLQPPKPKIFVRPSNRRTAA